MDIYGAVSLVICIIIGFLFFKAYTKKSKKIIFSAGTITLFVFMFLAIATVLFLEQMKDATELSAYGAFIISSISTLGSLFVTFAIIVFAGFIGE